MVMNCVGQRSRATIFDRLPADSLDMVISHLSQRDRQALRSTCHQTYELVNSRVRTVSITQTGNAKLDVALGPLHVRFPQANSLTFAAPLGNTELAALLTANSPLLARLRNLNFAVGWAGPLSWQNLAAVCRRCPTLQQVCLPPDTVRSAGSELLAELGLLPSLQNLCLDSSRALLDEHLLELSRFTSLTMLELASCERITDAGLAHLALLPRLSELRLRSLGGVEGSGLAACAASSSLHTLEMSHCQKLTAAGIEAVWCIRSLCSLGLRHTNLGGAALVGVSRLSYVTSLRLDGVQLTPGVVEAVAGLQRLNMLSLSNATRGQDSDLEPLTKLTALAVLNAEGYSSTPADLAALVALPQMNSLSLTTRTPPLPPPPASAGFRDLRRLCLHDLAAWHDGDLASLVALLVCPGRLQQLELCNIASITDAGISVIACALTGLTSLSLVGLRRVTDTGIMHLWGLRSLRHLALEQSDYVSIQAVIRLSGMASLEHLCLRDCWAISAQLVTECSALRKRRLVVSHQLTREV